MLLTEPIFTYLVIGLFASALLFAALAFWLWQSSLETGTVRGESGLWLEQGIARNVVHDFGKIVENSQYRLDEFDLIELDDEARWRQLVDEVRGDVNLLARYVIDRKLLIELVSERNRQRRELVVLSELCEKVARSFEVLARKRNARFVRDYPATTLEISANRDHIQRVLINLIDNAFKYADEEAPVVSVTIHEDREDGAALIEISDNGRGIPPESSERIWEESFKARDARTIDLPGTGLGLAIVKQVVEQEHHGKVSVRSQPGCTTFTVLLPKGRS